VSARNSVASSFTENVIYSRR